MKTEKQKRNRRTKQIIMEAEAPGAGRLAVAPFDIERLELLDARFEFWRDSPERRAAFEGMDAAELAEQKRLQTMLWMVEDWPVKRLDHLDDMLTIEIDFSKVNSPDALKEQVTKLFDICWFAYAQKTGHKTLKLQKDYEIVLKVGRMKRDNPAMTLKEIGKLIFPDADSPLREAKTRNEDYEKLINGEWQKLGFP